MRRWLPLALLLAACAAAPPDAPSEPPETPRPPSLWEPTALPPDQPLASAWFPASLLAWSPGTDPDAAFNRSAVPLRTAFDDVGPVASSSAHRGTARVNPLPAFAPTDGNPSQGHRSITYYAFGYWPYVDLLVYWGGSAGEGIILPPTAGVTDAAHRHGVPVLGTVFFPPEVYGGRIEWVREMLAREGDRFPAADKLIEVAEHYGFDGWFINQETEGGDAELARAMQDFLLYLQAHSDLRIEWYDAMNEAGTVRWQDALNTRNDAFFQDGDRYVSDDFFIDFGWDQAALRASRAHALALGRDPYRLYAGVDVQARGTGVAPDVALVFPEGEPPLTSLALYRPDVTLHADLDTFAVREQTLWVGADGDPSRQGSGWNGIGHHVAAAGTIDRLPVWTDFSPGKGWGYFREGQNVAPAAWAATGWNHLSLQGLQPTWQWWVASGGPPLRVGYDYERAYEGAASVHVRGAAAADQEVFLFRTRLRLPARATLDLAVQSARSSEAGVGLRFADAPDAPVALPLDAGAAWARRQLDLSAHAGRELVAISLRVPAQPAVDLRLGRLALYETAAPPSAPTAGSVVRRTPHADGASVSVRLAWAEPPQPVARYEVYQRLPGGTREFVGGASGTAAFVVAAADALELAVVAVGPDGERSAPLLLPR